MKLKQVLFMILIGVGCTLNTRAQVNTEPMAVALLQLKEFVDNRNYMAAIRLSDQLLMAIDSARYGTETGKIWFYRGAALHLGQRPAESLTDLRKALTYFHRNPTAETDRAVAEVYSVMGPAFAKVGQPDSCRIYHERGIAIFSRLAGPDSPDCAILYNTLAGYYIGRDSFIKAVRLRLRAYDIFEKNHLIQRACITANNLAAVYEWGGERGNALLFMRRAMSLIASPEVSGYYKAAIRASYATFLINIGLQDSAMLELRLARDEVMQIKDTTGIVNVYENTASIYAACGKHADALEVHRAMESIYSGRPAPYASYYANLYVVIARDFHMLGELDSSVIYWDKALAYQDTALGPFSRALADTYCEKARTQMQKGALEEACFSLQKSLTANSYRWNAVNSLSSLESGRATFLELAKCYRLNGKNREALVWIQKADTCIMNLRLSMQTSEAKSRLSSLARDVYAIGSEIAWECSQTASDRRCLDHAFHFSEQSKSILLSEGIRAMDHSFQGNISPSLRMLEDSLRSELAQSKSDWQKALAAKSTSIGEKEEKYFVQMRKYTTVLDTLKAAAPNYFDYRFGHKSVSTDSLSEWCNQHNQAVLSYFQTPDHIFAFLFQPHARPEMMAFDNHFGLDSLIRNVVSGITLYYNDPLRDNKVFREGFNRYAPAAAFLYTAIFQSVKAKLGCNRLVIIPDGNLAYLPFDALLTEKPTNFLNYDSYRYLASVLDIRYGFSATILCGLSKTKVPAAAGLPFISFAPFAYPDSEKLQMKGGPDQPLPESGNEAEMAARYFSGKVLLREKAALDSFCFYAPMAGALHVSTHGVSTSKQSEESCLWFAGNTGLGSFEKATISDICKLKLQAARVVISACDSGVGPLSPGEGVISVARAFAYAGVPEIVMTVLPVDDRASCKLMEVFYEFLSKGNETGTALWLAKKTFIETGKGNDSLPYFWAGFMLNGYSQK